MSRDDDPDRPDDDAPASPAEQAQAEAFGRLLDDVLDGEPLPPAMDIDQRALLDTAAQVLASTRVVELEVDRRRRIIDRALEQAIASRGGALADLDAGGSAAWAAPRRRAEKAMRALPWAVATIAAAAAIILFVTRPADLTASLGARAAARPAALPVELRSRPSDPLIGRIPRAEVAAASARTDAIWADRMASYRTLRLTAGDGVAGANDGRPGGLR